MPVFQLEDACKICVTYEIGNVAWYRLNLLYLTWYLGWKFSSDSLYHYSVNFGYPLTYISVTWNIFS